MDEETDLFSNSKSSTLGCCLAFAYLFIFFANFSLVVLIKVFFTDLDEKNTMVNVC